MTEQSSMMPGDRTERILILLLGAIGDVIRALPLAVRIRKEKPDAFLAWAVEPKSFGILEHHPALDRVIVFDRPGGFVAYQRFVQELRNERFDVVLDLQRHLKSGVTSFLTGAKRRIGFHRKNAKEGNWVFNNDTIPVVENFSAKISHYQHFGDRLGLAREKTLSFGLSATQSENSATELVLREHCQAAAIPLPPQERRVALLLGSSWPSRFWPARHFLQLSQALYQRMGMVCFLIGSGNEKELEQTLLSEKDRPPMISLVDKTSLSDLMQVLPRMRIAIGPDCGPMHLAAACGISVVSLWGATSPKRSAPYGSESLILHSPIACSPCYRRECPGLGNLCMKLISPEAVFAQVEREIAKDFKQG